MGLVKNNTGLGFGSNKGGGTTGLKCVKRKFGRLDYKPRITLYLIQDGITIHAQFMHKTLLHCGKYTSSEMTGAR